MCPETIEAPEGSSTLVLDEHARRTTVGVELDLDDWTTRWRRRTRDSKECPGPPRLEGTRGSGLGPLKWLQGACHRSRMQRSKSSRDAPRPPRRSPYRPWCPRVCRRGKTTGPEGHLSVENPARSKSRVAATAPGGSMLGQCECFSLQWRMARALPRDGRQSIEPIDLERPTRQLANIHKTL